MFKIKYIYQKGGPEYSCSYPDPKDSDHNIFIARGDNDKGKSTMLQMVALGLYGEKSEDIDDTLKDKMLRLTSEEIDKCEFEFTIVGKDGRIKLNSKLKEGRITTSVNDKIRPRTYIEDNFKVIYDVPGEPTRKLTSALRSVEDKLRQYEDYARRYSDEVNKIIGDIDDYEDKENRLKDERLELKRKSEEQKTRSNRLNAVRADFDKLEKARIVISYEKLLEEFAELDRYHTQLKRRVRKLKSSGARGGTAKYRGLIRNFRDNLLRLRFLADASTKLGDLLKDKEKKRMLAIKKEIVGVVSPNDLTDEKLKKWYNFFDCKILMNLKSNQIYGKKLIEENQIELLDQLVGILKNFIGLDATIPGTGGKNVNEFTKELEASRENLAKKISDKIALNKAIEGCDEILTALGNVATARAQIPKTEVTEEENLDEIEAEKTRVMGKMDEISKEMTVIENQYNVIPEHEKNKFRSLRDRVDRDYDNKKIEKSRLEQKIQSLKIEIGAKEQLVQEIGKIKKPPYKLSKKELKLLHDSSSKILRKTASWIEHIRSVDVEKMRVKDENINDEAKKFYMALGDYFADILKEVYFEHKGWSLKTIDIINRRYVVGGRKKPIDFVDLGTGHSKLNSLLARLKQNYGGKKKIVLFDEIGDMDDNNLGRLLDEIKMQVNSREVLFAFLTRMDGKLENVKVEPIK